MPYYPGYPQGYYPSQPYAPQQPRPSVPPQQQAAVRPQSRSAPIVRGQSPDEPRTVKPLPPMPTPEQLGVPVPKPVDWNDLRVRLDRIGASGFQLTQQTDGWRFTCRLPNGRQLEARGTSDADAVLNALGQVR
jgi:hypothetical protein